jgi:hypothetical protein
MDARAACHPDVVAVHISAPEKKKHKRQTETLDEAQDGLPSIAAVSGSLAAGSASDIVVPNMSQAAGSAGEIVVLNMLLAAGSAGDIVTMGPPIDFIGKPCGECGPASSSERAGLRSIVDAVAAKRGTSPRTKRRRRQIVAWADWIEAASRGT